MNKLNEESTLKNEDINSNRIQYIDVKLYGNKISEKNPSKLGELYAFFYHKERPLILIGKNDLSKVIIFECILLFIYIITYKTILFLIFPYMRYLYIIIHLTITFGHLYTFLANPGIPSRDNYSKSFFTNEYFKNLSDEDKNDYQICGNCNIVVNKNSNVQHCDICNICIIKYDHHCYWTGKCIGKNNIMAFYIFTFGTIVYIAWLIIMVIVWGIIKLSGYVK